MCGNHHHALQPDDYQPAGGVLDGMRVGLDQVMLDSVVALMPRFPVLTSNGLNLGRTPADIPGGAYYMNPEELPFEGEVPGTDGSVFYAGSGCGTGFKLGPGVPSPSIPRARAWRSCSASSARSARAAGSSRSAPPASPPAHRADDAVPAAGRTPHDAAGVKPPPSSVERP